MHQDQPTYQASPELVAEVRDHFRREADTNYADETIAAAINGWIEDRVERIYDDAAEVITSPHMAESLRFREILESVASPAAEPVTSPVPAPVPAAEHVSIFNGFRTFSPAKLGAMIEYIARSGRDIYKTNLNKLLFYSDLTFYFQHGHGISGATYLNLPYGPVPDTVEKVLDDLSATGKIARVPTGGPGSNAQLIKPAAAASSVHESSEPWLPGFSDLEIAELSEDEIKTLDWVFDQYGHLSPTQISELSHREKAYTSTRPNEPIAYEYSKFFLNLPGH